MKTRESLGQTLHEMGKRELRKATLTQGTEGVVVELDGLFYFAVGCTVESIRRRIATTGKGQTVSVVAITLAEMIEHQ